MFEIARRIGQTASVANRNRGGADNPTVRTAKAGWRARQLSLERNAGCCRQAWKALQFFRVRYDEDILNEPVGDVHRQQREIAEDRRSRWVGRPLLPGA